VFGSNTAPMVQTMRSRHIGTHTREKRITDAAATTGVCVGRTPSSISDLNYAIRLEKRGKTVRLYSERERGTYTCIYVRTCTHSMLFANGGVSLPSHCKNTEVYCFFFMRVVERKQASKENQEKKKTVSPMWYRKFPSTTHNGEQLVHTHTVYTVAGGLTMQHQQERETKTERQAEAPLCNCLVSLELGKLFGMQTDETRRGAPNVPTALTRRYIHQLQQ
jgi:hypothetical protein